MTEISVSEIMKLIKKADEAATPESLRALAEALPGSVKEIKMKDKNQSAFAINRNVIDAFKNKNRKKTLLTEDD